MTTRHYVVPRGSGRLYLVHLDDPLPGGARHYLGWTQADDVADRISRHREGRGAKLLAVARRLAIEWQVTAVWAASCREERRLKRMGHLARLCPLCRRGALHRHAAYERGRRAARPLADLLAQAVAL